MKTRSHAAWMLVCISLIAGDALAATKFVTSLADSGPGTLREAIALSASGDEILFSTNGTLSLSSGELVITNSLRIVGGSPTNLAISGSGLFRGFNVGANGILHISGVTIKGCWGGPITNSTYGGSAILNRGTVIASNCVLSGNHSEQHSSAAVTMQGAAIYNAGLLTVISSRIETNYFPFRPADSSGLTGGSGGAIYNTAAATCNVYRTWIKANVCGDGATSDLNGGMGGSGGGIYNSGLLVITDSTFSQNVAGNGAPGGAGIGLNTAASGGSGGSGGGLVNQGLCRITNTTFYGNVAGTGGRGGNSLNSWIQGGTGGDGGNGGSIYNAGTLVAGNTTITRGQTSGGGAPGNYLQSNPGLPGATGISGGIYSFGSAVIQNTIVASNTSLSSTSDLHGTFTSSAHNLVTVTNGATGISAESNLVSVPCGLEALAMNGGSTPTCALVPGSLALEAGDDAVLLTLTSDQRGSARKSGDHVDIGAFELDVSTLVPPTVEIIGAQTLAFAPGTSNGLALLRASVNPNGLPTATWFEIGNIMRPSVVVGQNAAGTNVVNIESGAAVAAGNSYQVRAVASNARATVTSSNVALNVPLPFAIGDFDGDGIVAPSEMNVVLSNYARGSQWLQMTNTAGLGSSNVEFSAPDFPASTFTVEYSTNLSNWQSRGIALPRYQFSDTNAAEGPQRYYRLRWP